MAQSRLTKIAHGQTLIEILLAIGLASIFLPAVLTGLVSSRAGKPQESQRLVATAYLREAEEAVRSVRENNWNLLTTADHYPQISGQTWSLPLGSEITSDGYTRTIKIADVNRSPNCNIVATGGLLDPDTKSISTVVSWPGIPQAFSVSSTTYLTNPKAKPKRGMLIYGDGGTTSDAIRYKTLNPCDGTWSAASATADVDLGTANKALRAAKLYSSSTRNEKILISRHYVSSTQQQYIYAQVFNGTTSTWGNVQLLSGPWNSNQFLDVQNFDGTYLANGDFMVVYSDNTDTPKFRVWTGSIWSAQTSTQIIGPPSAYIVASARPGTSEVMVAVFDQIRRTNTLYFNGGAYTQANWSITPQAITAPSNTTRYVDFAWSPNNPTKGALLYSTAGADRAMHIRIFTADGLGSGSWGTLATSSPAQSNNIGALSIAARPTANEFIACNKDTAATPRIICYKSDFTPTWTNPTNPTLVTGTDAGIQRSYHIGFESLAGDPALAVYSDNTAIPKLKKYTAATSTWDLAATNLNNLGGNLKSVRLIPREGASDDIMILMANANLDLFSLVWNGSAIPPSPYASPAGLAFSTHGLNGSATADLWYDFAWDKY